MTVPRRFAPNVRKRLASQNRPEGEEEEGEEAADGKG